MHDIKYIRDNFEIFKKKISKRNNASDINNILELDKKNRQLIQEKETLEKQKKDISKSKDENMFQKSKAISIKIKELSDQQIKTKSKIDNILSSIPNIPHSDVPEGNNEKSNQDSIYCPSFFNNIVWSYKQSFCSKINFILQCRNRCL